MRQFIKKKYVFPILIIISIFIVNIIISTTTGVNVLSNTINFITNKKSPNEVKSISLTSDGYNDNTGGSYNIEKSAKWTGTDKAQINFNVDTKVKRNNNHKDVIFVLDVSGSMSGSRISSVKKDTIDFISEFSKDKENQMAIISFDSEATTLLDWTNNSDDLVSRINGISNEISEYALTNYYQALIEVDKMLQSYKPKENRDLIVLFLTDGVPCMETPNEVAQYRILKEKYPYITINGIEYEMGNHVTNEIRNISDNQFGANGYNLSSIMNEAVYNIEEYEKFELVDYIDDKYFYVESVNDIKVSMGKVELTLENGVQKVIWKAEPNEFRTGTKANMTINLKLKEQYVGNEGYYPTNKKFEVITKLLDEKEVSEETDKTPILRAGYKVYFDTNTPTGCNLDNFEETHYAFENVKIANELTCKGYQFKGWKIIDDVKRLNDDYFVMPDKDITIKAIWAKQDITKSMDGTVYVAPPSIMKQYQQYTNDDYHNSKYREKITKVVVKDNTNIPVTAIESWDVSQEGNNSVVAYVEDDGTGNGTYKVTIGGNGKVIANEDSSYLFWYFSKLEEVDLKYLDTSNVINMSYMFSNCRSLTSLNLSNFDTSNVTDMNNMFRSCSNLTNLDLSNFDTSNVINMSSMFMGNSNLQNLDISSFDTCNVTDMVYMFDGCGSLESLDLSNFDTSNVTNMQYMFWDCYNLKTLDVSNFNTSKVTNMHGMFNNCSSLKTLDVNNFDTGNVTDMGEMFAGGHELTTLNVSNFNTSKVTNMLFMFKGCNKLTTIDVSNFNTSNVSNMRGMFLLCSNLTTLDLSSFDTHNVTDMSSMFGDCSKLTTTININGKPSRYAGMFQGAATDGGTKITVNYTSDNGSLVDTLIATKSYNSNIIKGSLITN